ncbi:MAG: hypothetical protein QOI01_3762 [Mycobacterium sp.]|jgi:hypothetical protein|nr:hypothetical protein [Mycobacterium sp.]
MTFCNGYSGYRRFPRYTMGSPSTPPRLPGHADDREGGPMTNDPQPGAAPNDRAGDQRRRRSNASSKLTQK